MGGDLAFQVLHSLMLDHCPDIVFLMETISDHFILESLRVKLGFDAKLVVDKEGKSGGLCLFWKFGVDIYLLLYSHFHIDTMVVSHF